MEVLEIDGVKFVKASTIARELGYTSDYVGQLCRTGKVKAQLVGRSWYVDHDSIKSHKKNRYRSTKIKTSEALKNSLKIDHEDVHRKALNQAAQNVVLPSTSKHFYMREVVSTDAKYSLDESELIPSLKEKSRRKENTVTKPHSIVVSHADARKVAIKKVNNSFNFEVTKRPTVHFAGTVTIVDVPDQEEILDGTKTTLSPKSASRTLLEKKQVTRHNKHSNLGTKVAIHTNDTNPVSKKMTVYEENKTEQKVPVKLVPTGFSGKVSSISQPGGELTVIRQPEESTDIGGPYNFIFITASIVLSLVAGLSLVALEQSTFITANTDLISSYSFNISAVFEAINIVK